jgi:hypothetical protein
MEMMIQETMLKKRNDVFVWAYSERIIRKLLERELRGFGS